MSTQAKPQSKGTPFYWISCAIGLFFILVFPFLPTFSTVTRTGMFILGPFLGMVILWSTVNSIWPSILGLLVISFSGIVPDAPGYAGVKAVFMNAFGNEISITIMLGLLFFNGLVYVGCTPYMARFFMTRKVIEGRPYVLMFMIFLCSYVLGGTASPMASMLLLWPIAIDICEKYGYSKGNPVFYSYICGIYLASTLGQPMFPFKGASYIVVSAFEKVSGLSVNYGAYILYNFVMAMLILAAYMLMLKFVFRIDMSALKNITVAEVAKEKLDPMNGQQKAFFLALVLYILALLLPPFFKTMAWAKFLSSLGIVGITVVTIVVLMVIPYKGGFLMDFKGIASKHFAWDIYFLVAAALYACNQMTADATGIKPMLVSVLQPILGGKPDIVFVAILLAFAIITTNFANNAGMAVAILPIVMAFVDQYQGVSLTALYMTVCMMVFVALLTPAASPYCGMLHAQRDLVSYGEIMKLFFPVFVIAYLLYVIIGYHLAILLFA